MTTQVCCPCIRKGHCDKCCCRRKGCTNCRNPACTFQRPQQHDITTKDLPETKEEAIASGVEILKELEFRCHRAAHMSYKLSDDYNWWVEKLQLIPVLSAFPSSALGKKLSEYWYFASDSWFNYLSFLFTTVIVSIFSSFKVCTNYILPAYEEKSKLHNDAGAGWQDLEIQIRGFRATNIKDTLTPERIEVFIKTLSEKRRDVCMIAKPTDKIREICKNLTEKFREKRIRRSDETKQFFNAQPNASQSSHELKKRNKVIQMFVEVWKKYTNRREVS